MKTTILTKMAIACAFTLLSPLALLSQNAAGSGNPVHVKIIKNINGNETVIDTIISNGQWNGDDGIDILIDENLDSLLQTGDGKKVIVKTCDITHNGTNIDSIVEKHIGDINDPEIQKIIKEMDTNPSSKGGKRMIIIDDKNTSPSKGASDKGNSSTQVKVIIKKYEVQNLSTEDKKMFQKEGGVTDNKLNVERINFFPNPNNGRFTLSFDLEGKGDTDVAIYNAEGKKVYQELLKGFTGAYKKEIDISQNAKGVYFLKVVQGKNSLFKKMIVD